MCHEGSGKGAFCWSGTFFCLLSANVAGGKYSRCTVWRCAIKNERCTLTVKVSGAVSSQAKFSPHRTTHTVVRVEACEVKGLCNSKMHQKASADIL